MELFVAKFACLSSNVSLQMPDDWRFIGLVFGTIAAIGVFLHNLLSITKLYAELKEMKRARRMADQMIHLPTNEEIKKYGTPQKEEGKNIGRLHGFAFLPFLFMGPLLSRDIRGTFSKWLDGVVLPIFIVVLLVTITSTVCVLYLKYIRYGRKSET